MKGYIGWLSVIKPLEQLVWLPIEFGGNEIRVLATLGNTAAKATVNVGGFTNLVSPTE